MLGEQRTLFGESASEWNNESQHLNFSNPNVAQRLPLELKRTDDELRNRDSQEIRRIQ